MTIRNAVTYRLVSQANELSKLALDTGVVIITTSQVYGYYEEEEIQKSMEELDAKRTQVKTSALLKRKEMCDRNISLENKKRGHRSIIEQHEESIGKLRSIQGRIDRRIAEADVDMELELAKIDTEKERLQQLLDRV